MLRLFFAVSLFHHLMPAAHAHVLVDEFLLYLEQLAEGPGGEYLALLVVRLWAVEWPFAVSALCF